MDLFFNLWHPQGPLHEATQQCNEHLQMAQGIQSLLSDQVPQVLLHLPRKREQRNPLHEHLQEDSQEHLDEKMCPPFRASMQRGKFVPWFNLLCGLCFLWGRGLQQHHGHQVHPRRGKPQTAALNLHRPMENCLEIKFAQLMDCTHLCACITYEATFSLKQQKG